MAHIHSIYDNDTHFKIDPITREIENTSGKVTLQQNDHNSERFTFEIPRYIDGHDMSLCNKVEVHFINVDAATRKDNRGVYPVKDLQISPDSDDVVICSWLISQNATKYAGTLNFVLKYACFSDDVKIVYRWFSGIHRGISVGESYYNGDAIVEEYSDILAEWEKRISELEQNGGGNAGVYVGEEEPTDENVKVWINPNGDATILDDDELPKVFFSGNANPMTKDNSVELDISYRSNNENFDGYVEIKWQGSSSIAYPKKNYTIKMFNKDGSKLKKSFCGWGKQNKFCLKANYVDATHARNIISARLWSDVVASRVDYETLPIELRTSPNNGAIDGFPIKLYMNGQYQGIYTWNIPKDAWMWNMDKDNPNHIVLCAEENTHEPHTCNFNLYWNGVDGDGWSVEVGTNNDATVKCMNDLIGVVLHDSDDSFKVRIGNHLDIQSAIDYYIHQLVIYGKDNMARNMLLATYDLRKWYMGAYDMDSTFGMEWNGSVILPSNTPIESGYNANDSLLWARIRTLYADEISARYDELRKTIYTVPNMVTMFERFMDTIGKDLYAEDIEIFPDIPSANITNIKQLRTFIAERLKFIDKQLLPATPIYQLKNTTVFDGTNYINTGVDLDGVEEYTVMVDYTIKDLTENRGMLVDRFDPYTNNGWGVQYQKASPSGTLWTDSWTDFAAHGWDCTNPVGIRNKIIIRKQKNGTITLFTLRGTNNVDASATIKEGKTGLYVTLGAKCWVGEELTSYDSFIKATMHDCKIYDVALSDEECNAYVTEV